MPDVTKREFLIFASGAAALAITGVPYDARSAEMADEAIAEFLGGATPEMSGITLEMPEIAENGNTVPLTVRVEGDPAKNHAESVMVLAAGNPAPGVATFHFSSMSGTMEASTRMRLAKTQDVIAVAKMSDGTFRRTDTLVKVTIGGCGG